MRIRRADNRLARLDSLINGRRCSCTISGSFPYLWPLRNLGTFSGMKWFSNSLPLDQAAVPRATASPRPAKPSPPADYIPSRQLLPQPGASQPRAKHACVTVTHPSRSARLFFVKTILSLTCSTPEAAHRVLRYVLQGLSPSPRLTCWKVPWRHSARCGSLRHAQKEPSIPVTR